MSILRGSRHVALFLFSLALALASASSAGEPLVIALLLDTSGSIRPEDLIRVQTLTRNLLVSLPPGCEIAVYKFNDDSHLVLEKTTQVQQIEKAIGDLRREGRFTALYDALFDGSQYLEKQSARRRAILLLTDGKNEGGQMGLDEGLEIARKQKIPIFSVGMGKAINQRILRRIAEQTGGTYSTLSTVTGQDLAKAVQVALSVSRADVTKSAGASGPSRPSPPPDHRVSGPTTYALIALLALVGSLALWWGIQKSKAHASVSPTDSTDSTATVWSPQQEPLPELETVKAPFHLQADPTVRLQLKKASLTVREGHGAGQIFPVPSFKMTLIGRIASAEVPVDDPAISSEHCRIVPEGGGYVLRDLKSTNGTTVNGFLVKEHNLKNGDLIQVGQTRLEFALSQEK